MILVNLIKVTAYSKDGRGDTNQKSGKSIQLAKITSMEAFRNCVVAREDKYGVLINIKLRGVTNQSVKSTINNN